MQLCSEYLVTFPTACTQQRDDIVLGGRDEIKLNEMLRTVLKGAKDHGITFNKDKCQFGEEEIEFFGHVLKVWK